MDCCYLTLDTFQSSSAIIPRLSRKYKQQQRCDVVMLLAVVTADTERRPPDHSPVTAREQWTPGRKMGSKSFISSIISSNLFLHREYGVWFIFKLGGPVLVLWCPGCKISLVPTTHWMMPRVRRRGKHQSVVCIADYEPSAKFSRSQRRYQLGPSPGWKCLVALSHLRHS